MRRIVLFALSVVALSLMAGCGPNESQRYLHAITVDNYRKVAEEYDVAYFVGEARDDILMSIHGPGDLRVVEDDIDVSGPLSQHLGSGQGTLDGGVRCRVLVFRLLPSGSTPPYLGKGELTEKEMAGFVEGTVYVLRVSALCEPQADR